MTIFALASEYDRLTPAEQTRVDHIIADDGEWSDAMLADYIASWRGACVMAEIDPEDWTRKAGELL